MKNMNCVSTMPEIMPEITDEAIIEALFAQRPYEEKVINSAFLEIPAEYQRKLNIPNVEKMSAEFTELIANPPKVSYRDGHYYVFDGQHTLVTRKSMNGGAGNWNDAAKEKYKIDGDMEKMFDTTVEADKVIAYNLFPQTATNGTGASTTDVKTSMPHFVLKLTTKANGTTTPRWLTIRALKAADALVTSFDAGKVYVPNAADININQYSAKLKVTANDTAGPEIPEPIDPTDPNPEPVGKDLDVLVKITEWTIVNVKPEW